MTRFLQQACPNAFVVLSVMACSASDKTVTASLDSKDAGAACLHASDCSGTQTCLFRTCSEPCAKDKDCASGTHCLATGDGTACVSSSQAACTAQTACPGGTNCTAGERRGSCATGAVPCPGGQQCTGAVCVSVVADAGSSGRTGTGGASNGGAANTGGRSSGGAGGTLGSGGASGSGGGPDASVGTGGAGTGGTTGSQGAGGNGAAPGGGSAGHEVTLTDAALPSDASGVPVDAPLRDAAHGGGSACAMGHYEGTLSGSFVGGQLSAFATLTGPIAFDIAPADSGPFSVSNGTLTATVTLTLVVTVAVVVTGTLDCRTGTLTGATKGSAPLGVSLDGLLRATYSAASDSFVRGEWTPANGAGTWSAAHTGP